MNVHIYLWSLANFWLVNEVPKIMSEANNEKMCLQNWEHFVLSRPNVPEGSWLELKLEQCLPDVYTMSNLILKSSSLTTNLASNVCFAIFQSFDTEHDLDDDDDDNDAKL